MATSTFSCCAHDAGQERFGNMTRVYYREAVGAFVVFDVTRASTFEAVSKWKHDLDTKVCYKQSIAETLHLFLPFTVSLQRAVKRCSKQQPCLKLPE